MKWYYADGAEKTGPVTEPQIESLFQAGRINTSTLVWHDGMGAWLPFGQVKPALVEAAEKKAALAGQQPSSGPDVAAAEVVCSQCNQIFPRAQLIMIRDHWVCANCKPAFVQKLKEGTLGGRRLEYAGFGIRLVAKLLDNLIFHVLGVGLATGAVASILFTGGVKSEEEAAAKILILALAAAGAFLLVLPIQMWCLATKGGTPGKRICKLRVISATGENIGWGKAIGRVFAEILTQLIPFAIGYIIAAFDTEKRAVHDHLARTRVVKD